MPKTSTTTTTQRRTQFSSCDACRHSRIACDASKHGHKPGDKRWRGSCSKCSQRKRPCTFEWINNGKKKPPNLRQRSTSDLPAPVAEANSNASSPDPPFFSGESTNPEVESVSVGFPTHWSDEIFHLGFEAVFRFSIGRHGCPLINDPSREIFIPATQLFGKLDALIDEELDDQNIAAYATETRESRQGLSAQIDQSLRCVIRAFSARWLPLVSRKHGLASEQVDHIVRDSWRAARKDMLKVMNRVSYRSILTLYLFAQTPTPVDISGDEESEGISASACMQTAILQIQRLRQRPRSGLCHGAVDSNVTQAFLDLESRAYWAVIMWDTSNSFDSNSRTCLTSGLKGACSEPAWRLARSYLVGSFRAKTEHWRIHGFEMTEERACTIISSASISILYIWKNITSLKEALREGVEEDSVMFAWNALLDAIDIFTTSIRPLLDHCKRRLHFLDQQTRLSWYATISQYYLGILVLGEVLETANRSDLLPGVAIAKQDAEYEAFNVLKLGMQASYMIYGPGDDLTAATTIITIDGGTGNSPARPIITSLVAISPYPYQVVNTVSLMKKTMDRKYREGVLKHQTYAYLSDSLRTALEQLPQHSKKVDAALKGNAAA
ncbi:hypothetical protein K504DRAFT_434871 [Pleomassaria siparia CBS 279.74]|uniref:Zn(2)-C6 fungal-type domain-containing protein n=1 Tax=Pleomassaria siparia CBS 279.74 TaxID=1314801 RepID=A0A6G1K713_9PLEO|nr:hypothetical protein K504DRAFT_434871 [Pleomassaria siparia CBS 279.74]